MADGLARAGVEYALCGGCAVVVYGYVRATKDIDLMIQQGSLEIVAAALAPKGFTLRAGPIAFASGTPKERKLYRLTKVVGTDHLTVDLLIVTEVLKDVWSDRATMEWAGRTMPIVSRKGLGKMKRLAARPQDLVDLEVLGIEVEPDGT